MVGDAQVLLEAHSPKLPEIELYEAPTFPSWNLLWADCQRLCVNVHRPRLRFRITSTQTHLHEWATFIEINARWWRSLAKKACDSAHALAQASRHAVRQSSNELGLGAQGD